MTSQCPRCEGSRFTVDVPSELTSYTDSTALACCQRCLAVEPDEPDEPAATAASPPFDQIITRFPTGNAGVGMLVLIDNLDSLALNRREIESLVDYLEANGIDLFLTLDRLVDEPELEPYLDLARRRDQLAALLE